MHKFLMKMPPETAHEIGLRLLRFAPRINLPDTPKLKINTRLGLLRNPIGLAAGFDKFGSYASDISKLGFGYLVLGTVTKNKRLGNKKPRIARLEEDMALVNCMGFPNPGLEQFLKNLKKSGKPSCPIVVSISDEQLEYLVECYEYVQEVADGVEINISSPNTPKLKQYFDVDACKE